MADLTYIALLLYLFGWFITYSIAAVIASDDREDEGMAFMSAAYCLGWPLIWLLIGPFLWWNFLGKKSKEWQDTREREKQEALERGLKAKLDAADKTDYRGNT